MERLGVRRIFVSVAVSLCWTDVAVAEGQDTTYSWTRQISGTTLNLRAVTWTGSQWLAVGDSGAILRSSDAVHWAPESSGVTARLQAVSGNEFVAAIGGQPASPSGVVPDSGGLGDVFPEATLLVRQNGAGWTRKSAGSLALYTMAVKDTGPWVAAGNFVLMASTNQGGNWSPRSFIFSDVFSVAKSPSLWAAVGYKSSDGTPMIQTSADTKTWTEAPAPAGTQGVLFSVTWTGSQYVAVGSVTGDSGRVLLTSANGGSWVARSFGSQSVLYGVAGVPGGTVAVGNAGTIALSSDGIAWNLEESGVQSTLRAVAANASQFVVVGDSGTILTRKQDTVVPLRAGTAARRPPPRTLKMTAQGLRIHVRHVDASGAVRERVYALDGRKVVMTRVAGERVAP